MGLGARIEKALDKVYLRFRHPDAFTVTSGQPGDFSYSIPRRLYATVRRGSCFGWTTAASSA